MFLPFCPPFLPIFDFDLKVLLQQISGTLVGVLHWVVNGVFFSVGSWVVWLVGFATLFRIVISHDFPWPFLSLLCVKSHVLSRVMVRFVTMSKLVEM